MRGWVGDEATYPIVAWSRPSEYGNMPALCDVMRKCILERIAARRRHMVCKAARHEKCRPKMLPQKNKICLDKCVPKMLYCKCGEVKPIVNHSRKKLYIDSTERRQKGKIP